MEFNYSNKGIMVINMKKRISDFAILGDSEKYLYFTSEKNNLLIVISKDGFNLVKVFCLPDENMDSGCLVGSVVETNRGVVLAPRNAKKIWILNNESFSGIDINEYVSEKCNHKFLSSAKYNNHVFLFGHFFPGIIGIDIETLTVDYVYKVPEEIINLKEDGDCPGFAKQSCIVDNCIYLAYVNSSCVVKFDMESMTTSWIDINDNEGEAFGLSKDIGGKGFWISKRDSKGMLLWDGTGNVIDEYINNFSPRINMGVCTLKNKILLPNYNQRSYLYDVNRNNWEEDDEIYSFLDTELYYYFVKYDNLVIYNKSTDEEEVVRIDLDELDSYCDDLLKTSKFRIGMIYEGDPFSLEGYINSIR